MDLLKQKISPRPYAGTKATQLHPHRKGSRGGYVLLFYVLQSRFTALLAIRREAPRCTGTVSVGMRAA
ncbi:MAG: hypothetical protein Q6L68_15655 [Thermostichus sp. DG02_5_bins_236]